MRKIISSLLALLLTLSLCTLPITTTAWADEEVNRVEIISQARALLFPADREGDAEAALELLLPLAEAGDAEAQYYCAWIYDFEFSEYGNREENLNIYRTWRDAAMGQDFAKAYALASIDSSKLDAQRHEYANKAVSLGFLEMSDEQLAADGIYLQGRLFFEGLAVEQDYNKTFDLFSNAIELGLRGAEGDIAYLYLMGLGVEPDYEKAFDVYSAGADAGHSVSMHNLAYMYLNGLGMEKDYAKAFEWYSKAAQLGYPTSMHQLGYMYHDGLGVEPDYDMAMNKFIDAVINGGDKMVALDWINGMLENNQGVRVYVERQNELQAFIFG